MEEYLDDIVGLSFNIVINSMFKKTPAVSFGHSAQVLGKEYKLDLCFGYNTTNNKYGSAITTDDWQYIFNTISVATNKSEFIHFTGDKDQFENDMALVKLVLAGGQ